MGRKERQKQIEDIFLQKEINLAVKKARRKEERRTKAQRFLNKPLKRMKGGRGGARITVRKGIKSLWDLI